MNYEEYEKALKKGQRCYRHQLARGEYPYLPVLDHILRYTPVRREVYLGTMDIPLDQVVGTSTEGRSHAFAANFMPLLEKESEFSMKWEALCRTHLDEGIKDPVKVYEFMNRFYVQEGNKRVSVLKFYNAVSISASVYRLAPVYSAEDRDIRLYYEFMNFYDLTGLNVIWFSREGSYKSLVKATGNSETERWDDEAILMLRSLYNHFQLAYKEKNGSRLSITVSDAMLKLIQIYGYEELCEDSAAALKTKITKAWEELEVLTEEDAVELKLDPTEKAANPILNILAPVKKKYRIGFVNDKDPKTSAWTYGHDLGRAHLQNTYPDLLVNTYNEALKDGKPEAVIQKAVDDGCDLIFTTSPRLLDGSVKAAVKNSDVRILNCSLNTSYKSVRTYYGRMYEAKFLSGIVAGAMCQDKEVGYVADYPLYGMIANINAFALGVQMTNPKARVKLFWSKLIDQGDQAAEMERMSYVCGQELTTPCSPSREFGLYGKEGGNPANLIAPVWRWGEYYVRILDTIRHGLWNSEKDKKALNYWWGLPAGVVDVLCSGSMPSGVRKLVGMLRENIIRGDLRPFSGVLHAQGGRIITNEEYAQISAQDIMKMDWLLENIDGRIPTMEELTEEAKQLTRIQGVVGDKV